MVMGMGIVLTGSPQFLSDLLEKIGVYVRG